MRLEPPRLARVLVRLSSAEDDTTLLLADLDERFDAIASERGGRAARRWYWSQALRGTHAWLRPDFELLSRRTWEGTAGDVRQSARSLLRRPLYTAGVVGTLAIGLASAATVLAVAWHVWLAPLPFPDPDRVVRLFEVEFPDAPAGSEVAEGRNWRISPPLLEDLRAHDWQTVEAVAGVAQNAYDWSREDGTTRIMARSVSPEVFDILGIVPLLGRALSADGQVKEVVLTEPFWRSAFGADPGVLDRSMTLRGEEYRVVGVASVAPVYPGESDVIMSMAFGEDQLVEGMRGARYLDVVARVDLAYRVSEASAEMDQVMNGLGQIYSAHEGWGGSAVPLYEEIMRPYRSVLGLLLAAGGVFLILAVVNVAGLVAARTVEGRAERSVRLALGASEGRLLRGGIIESLLLGSTAGAVALFFAFGLLDPLLVLVPADIPRVESVRLSPEIGAGIFMLALLSGLTIGALGYLLSRSAHPAIGRSANAASAGLAGRRMLVAGQVALTTLLATTGAGILRHSTQLRAIDIGFTADGVVSSQVMLGGGRFPTVESRLVYWEALLDRIQIRGADVAIGTSTPMAGVNMPWGYRPTPTSEQAFAQYHIVSENYFSVLDIAVLEGRAFTSDDREGSPDVIVVNDVLADEHFPGESPVGRDIEVVGQQKTIVGVVAATRHTGPESDPPAEIYASFRQDPWPHAQVLMLGTPELAGSTFKAASSEVDPSLGVPPMAEYSRFVDAWFAALRLQLIIVGVLAVVGTALATLGLYALVAYQVTSRAREIGVHMALGASDRRMFTEVVRRGLVLAVFGMILGFGMWYVSLPLTRGLLGEVNVWDPWVPVAVATLVGMVSLLASVLPARRSVTVDPAVTLRAE
jgi:putative ABC transport system permease protein